MIRCFLLFGIFGISLMVSDVINVKMEQEESQVQLLNKKICKNAANASFVADRCCHYIIDTEDPKKDCVNFYAKGDEPASMNAKLVLASKINACTYKGRRYIKSNTQLNMGGVKAHANKLYHNDTNKRNFMINMYRECGRKATTLLEKINKNPKTKDIFRGTTKPYFILISFCVSRYLETKCPYFKWVGYEPAEEHICSMYASTCEKEYLGKENITDTTLGPKNEEGAREGNNSTTQL